MTFVLVDHSFRLPKGAPKTGFFHCALLSLYCSLRHYLQFFSSDFELFFVFLQGYNHSYYFITTFIEDHIKHHARYLTNA